MRPSHVFIHAGDTDALDAAKRRDASVPREWERSNDDIGCLGCLMFQNPDRTRTAASKQHIVNLLCLPFSKTAVLLCAWQPLSLLGGSCLVCA